MQLPFQMSSYPCTCIEYTCHGLHLSSFWVAPSNGSRSGRFHVSVVTIEQINPNALSYNIVTRHYTSLHHISQEKTTAGA